MQHSGGHGAVADRRARRRQESVDEVVTIALQVMREAGAGGLSLGEVARRMGIRPPSLYGYFSSKAALCDEIFARGWVQVDQLMADHQARITPVTDPGALLQGVAEDFVRWALAEPGYAQLMFWRPMPGWEPSPAAYAPATAALERLHATLRELRDHGHLRADTELEEATGVWTVLVSGLISQLLANEPRTTITDSRFASLLTPLVQMFADRYQPTREGTRP